MTAIGVSEPLSAAVVLDGEIDISTCPAVRRLLMAAVSGGNVHLAVNMSGVTFIDAGGIGVLVAAANRARQAGGGLSLLAPSPQVRRLLDVFHLDAILPIAERLGGPSRCRQRRLRLLPGLPKDEERCGSRRPRRSTSHAFRSASATWLSRVSFRCGA